MAQHKILAETLTYLKQTCESGQAPTTTVLNIFRIKGEFFHLEIRGAEEKLFRLVRGQNTVMSAVVSLFNFKAYLSDFVVYDDTCPTDVIELVFWEILVQVFNNQVSSLIYQNNGNPIKRKMRKIFRDFGFEFKYNLVTLKIEAPRNTADDHIKSALAKLVTYQSPNNHLDTNTRILSFRTFLSGSFSTRLSQTSIDNIWLILSQDNGESIYVQLTYTNQSELQLRWTTVEMTDQIFLFELIFQSILNALQRKIKSMTCLLDNLKGEYLYHCVKALESWGFKLIPQTTEMCLKLE